MNEINEIKIIIKEFVLYRIDFNKLIHFSILIK